MGGGVRHAPLAVPAARRDGQKLRAPFRRWELRLGSGAPPAGRASLSSRLFPVALKSLPLEGRGGSLASATPSRAVFPDPNAASRPDDPTKFSGRAKLRGVSGGGGGEKGSRRVSKAVKRRRRRVGDERPPPEIMIPGGLEGRRAEARESDAPPAGGAAEQGGPARGAVPCPTVGRGRRALGCLGAQREGAGNVVWPLGGWAVLFGGVFKNYGAEVGGRGGGVPSGCPLPLLLWRALLGDRRLELGCLTSGGGARALRGSPPSPGLPSVVSNDPPGLVLPPCGIRTSASWVCTWSVPGHQSAFSWPGVYS